MPAPGGPIPEGMVGPIKARGSGDQPSATRRMVPGRRPAALPTTGRLVAEGRRQGRQGLRHGTPPDVRWRSGGFRDAGNRPQDAPSAEGASRRVIRLRPVTRSTRGPPGATSGWVDEKGHRQVPVSSTRPLWPRKVSRRSRDPFLRRAGWPRLASPEVELCEMRGCLPGRG